MPLKNCLRFSDSSDPSHQEYNNVLKSITVKVSVCMSVVDIQSTLVYENPSDKRLEADFMFPLASSASVYHMEMKTSKKTIVACCKGKSEAEEIYEKAKKEGHTVLTASEDGETPDIFHIKLGNIDPKEVIEIKLAYTMLADVKIIECKSGKIQRSINFALPEVLCPRFGPKNNESPMNNKLGINVQQKMYKFKFNADLTMEKNISEVTSPNLKYITDFKNPSDKKRAHVTLANDFEGKDDIEIHTVLEEEEKSCSNFSIFLERGFKDKNSFLSKHCLMASFRPQQLEKARETRNEFIFVIDQSGSMRGSNNDKAKESLLLFLKSLQKNSRFQIISFGSTFKSLFNEPVDVTEANIDRALAYQRTMNADMGGTVVYGALEHAFNNPLSGEGWQKQIIVITDGQVWNIDQIKALISEHSNEGRVFSVGLGSGASTAFVEGLAEAGKGQSRFARESSELNSAVMDIFSMAVQPRASDVKVEWKSGKGDLKIFQIPSEIKAVYAEYPLTAFGIFDGDFDDLEGTATLSYTMKGEKYTMTETFGPNNVVVMDDEKLPIHRIAAKSQLKELTIKCGPLRRDEKKTNELKEVEDQMKLLSIESNVCSPVTSFICVDPEKKENNMETITIKSSPQNVELESYACNRSMPMMKKKCRGGFSGANLFSSMKLSSPARSQKRLKCVASMDDCFEEKSSTPKVEDPFIQIVQKQSFNGNWTETSDLYKNIQSVSSKLTESKVKALKPNKCKGEIRMTHVVIFIFRHFYKSKENEWVFLVEKADDWLAAQTYGKDAIAQKMTELQNIASS